MALAQINPFFAVTHFFVAREWSEKNFGKTVSTLSDAASTFSIVSATHPEIRLAQERTDADGSRPPIAQKRYRSRVTLSILFS